MKVQISDCNTLLEPVALVGAYSRSFPYSGKSYGPNVDRDRAWNDALAWIVRQLDDPRP